MEPWNFSFKSFGRVLDRNSVTVISDFHVFSFLFFFTPFLSFDGVIILLKLNFYRKFSFHRPSEKSNSQWNCIFAQTDNIVCSNIFLTVLTAITIPHESFSQIWISSRGGVWWKTLGKCLSNWQSACQYMRDIERRHLPRKKAAF